MEKYQRFYGKGSSLFSTC